MPIDWTRDRHLAQPSPAQIWRCPACRTQNTSRIEDGCPACGAGTAAANAAAQASNQPPVNLVPLVLGEAMKGLADKTVAAFVELKPYTLEARVTVAAALMFACENGMTKLPDGLDRPAMVAWARAITRDEGD